MGCLGGGGEVDQVLISISLSPTATAGIDLLLWSPEMERFVSNVTLNATSPVRVETVRGSGRWTHSVMKCSCGIWYSVVLGGLM